MINSARNMPADTKNTTGLEQDQKQQLPMTTKEKLINAIPLLLVVLILCYFSYSCQQNKKITRQTTDFVQEYNESTQNYDQNLDRWLHQEVDLNTFQQTLQDDLLPSMLKLQETIRTLPVESSAYVIALPEIRQVVELKIRLAHKILELKDNDVTPLNDSLKQIMRIQMQIQAQAETESSPQTQVQDEAQE